MSKPIVAQIVIPVIDSSGTHLTFQSTYCEKTYGSTTVNLGPVLIGLTGDLTNIAIGTAIANACNSNYGTSWTFADVLLVGGVSFL